MGGILKKLISFVNKYAMNIICWVRSAVREDMKVTITLPMYLLPNLPNSLKGSFAIALSQLCLPLASASRFGNYTTFLTASVPSQ